MQRPWSGACGQSSFQGRFWLVPGAAGADPNRRQLAPNRHQLGSDQRYFGRDMLSVQREPGLGSGLGVDRILDWRALGVEVPRATLEAMRHSVAHGPAQ